MNFPPRSFAAQALAFTVASCGMLISPADLSAETEIIPNDKFADNGASWTLTTGRGAQANMSVETVDGEPALRIAVENSTEDEVPVGIQRRFEEIQAGKSYYVTFKAKAEQDTEVVASISPVVASNRPLWRVAVPLTMEWNEFNFTFKKDGLSTDCSFGISSLGKANNTFWIRDVVLTVE